MFITEHVENIVEIIKSCGVPAKPAADPLQCFTVAGPAIYVLPADIMYVSQGRERKSVTKIRRHPAVCMMIVRRYESCDETGCDIATWDEVKAIFELVELLTNEVIKQTSPTKVELEIQMTDNLSKGYHVSAAYFTYYDPQCPESNSKPSLQELINALNSV